MEGCKQLTLPEGKGTEKEREKVQEIAMVVYRSCPTDMLWEDLQWNATNLFGTSQEPIQQESYGTCNACFGPLSRPKWHQCNVCWDYDECQACYDRKEEAQRKHPHTMTEMVWGLFADGSPYVNVLCFDGGGIRGYTTLLLFQKYCQALMAKHEGNKLTEDQFAAQLIQTKFHLLVGTSIGGILALLFAMGTPLSRLLRLFQEDKEEIFTKAWFWQIGSAKYQAAGIVRVFERLATELGHQMDIKLGDLHIPVGVTTYDITHGRIHLFSKDTHAQMRVIDAALATSAAPTYFPVHMVSVNETELRCVDGGVWGNDPRLYGLLVERTRPANVNRLRKYALFSFGTGTPSMREPSSSLFDWQSSLGWIYPSTGNIIDVFMDSSADLVERVMEQLERTQVVKSTKLQAFLPEPIALDDTKSLDMQEANVKKQFRDSDVAKNALASLVRLSFYTGNNITKAYL